MRVSSLGLVVASDCYNVYLSIHTLSLQLNNKRFSTWVVINSILEKTKFNYCYFISANKLFCMEQQLVFDYNTSIHNINFLQCYFKPIGS